MVRALSSLRSERCAVCGKVWRLVKDDNRPSAKSCLKCRPAYRAKTRQTRKVVRAARGARPEALPDAGPFSADALAKAIRDADAASERALALARSLAPRNRTD